MLVFSFLSSMLYAQKNSTFQHSYGGSNDDFGGSILELPDNGYIMTGFTKSFGSGGYDMEVIRVDSLGKEIWSNVYGGKQDEGNVSFYVYPSMDVTLSSDTNIVICSNTASYGAGGKDVYLLKLDLNGKVKWSRTYGGSNDDIGYAITKDPAGGFLIAGQTLSYGAGNGDAWLIKTNDTGGVVWSNTYGNSSNEEAAYRIIPLIDGNYLMAGYSHSSSTAYDLMLIKVNKSGKLLWSKVFGTSTYDFPNDILELPDKTIYFDGATYNGSGNSMALSKLDSMGNLEWTKTYGVGTFRSMTYDKNKKYINIFGNGLFAGNAQRIYLAKFDTSGGFKFLKSYGPTSTTNGYSMGEGHLMLSLSNGGFVALGEESVYGAGNNDIYLIKTDANGDANFCNTLSFNISPVNYPYSYYNYAFTTTSISPNISGGVKTISGASMTDSAICPPFVANFGIQRKTDHNMQFSDSSYYGTTGWSWDFGEPSFPSNTSASRNPSHIYHSEGSFKVKLIATNGANIKDSITKTVKIALTDIPFQGSNLTAQLFPNPASNALHIKGQPVLTLQTNSVSDEEIEIRSFAKGLYIINIQTAKGSIKSRFVKE